MSISDSSYEGRFQIPTPKGVYQAAGDTNISTDYAYRAQNIRTERGLLASAYGTTRAFPSLGSPIRTLTRFTRRTRPDDPEIFVAASGSSIYTYTAGTEGWVKRADGFLSDSWSYVTYEAVSHGETVDVLILSNEKDGMIALYGDDLRAEPKTLTIGNDYSAVKFAVLGRYAERIWGAGAIGYPDHIFYSKPYNPFDWTGVADTPELGGGLMQQPTWDGESFLALVPYGGYLLGIKPSTVFEIRGSDPSSFTITEAFGTDGPVEARTICTDSTEMLYLSSNGIGRYNGDSISLLSRDALYETMRLRMDGMEQAACACVCGRVYYLALCVRENEGDVLSENNTVVEYDMQRGTFMVRKGMRVKHFFSLGGKVYYTDAQSPYEVMNYSDPQAAGYLGQPMESSWVTPWLDLGKTQRKRDFVLHFTAQASEEDVPLELTLTADRREKTRTVLLKSARRDYRVPIQLTGKRIQLTVSQSRRAANWQITGGIQVDYTTDEA